MVITFAKFNENITRFYSVLFNKSILEGNRNKDKRKEKEANNYHHGNEHRVIDNRDNRKEHGKIVESNQQECDEKYANWQKSVNRSLKNIEGSLDDHGDVHDEIVNKSKEIVQPTNVTVTPNCPAKTKVDSCNLKPSGKCTTYYTENLLDKGHKSCKHGTFTCSDDAQCTLSKFNGRDQCCKE